MADAEGRAAKPPVSFSVIIESENLAGDGLVRVEPLLRLLERQTLPIRHADRVIIVDGGRVPARLIETARARWPWLSIHRLPHVPSYYEAKQVGSQVVDSEVCVFVDCDVEPSESWLESMLEPFHAATGPLLVAGETCMRTDTMYGCAVMMSWWLHTPSGRPRPFVSPVSHHGNNFAAHRRVLQDTPLPYDEPLYRATTRVHWEMLLERGVQVLKHPQAVVYHPPPPSLRQWTWRMLIGARDAVVLSGLRRQGLRCTWHPSLRKRLHAYRGLVAARVRALGRKTRWLWRAGTPRRRIITAMPIAVAGLFVDLAGGFVACLWPDAILRGIRRFEARCSARYDPERLAAQAGGIEGVRP